MNSTILLSLGMVAAGASGVLAQAQLVPKEDAIKGAAETDVPVWNPSLAGTATVSMVSNSNVVGQVEGFSTLFGLGLVGGLDYVKESHVLRNSLSISESFARTPVIDEFVKTNDVLQFESIYNYFVTKNFGGFGRLSLQTSAFAADDVRGQPTTWVEKPAIAGDPPRVLRVDATRQRLADPFKPFTINESVGAFVESVHHEKLNLAARLGIGGRHTFADRVRLIDDDKSTMEVELLRLSNVHQLGIEAFAGATGKASEGKLAYRLGLSALLPFVNNDKFERSAGSLARIGLEGNLTFNVFDWMSVIYSLTVVRDPQLFPKGNELVQVQNNLLLTLKFSFVTKIEGKKPPTKEEQELMDAKARAEAAEKRALELEQQIRDAEAAKQQQQQPPPTSEPLPTPPPTPPPTTPTPTPIPPQP
jgi:hypothetical protein